jgi:hypothetical protein
MNSGLPAYAGCHDLQFESGSLSTVDKEIGDVYNAKSAELLDRIFTFLKAAEDTSQTVSVSPEAETEYEGLRFRTVTFRVGPRSLNLIVTQPIGSSRGNSEVRLTESLGAARPPGRKE